MPTWLVVLIVILVLVVLYGIYVYNRLIAEIETVRNAERQIDVQLDRRFKVFQSLIEVVKKYMDYEKTTLKDVVALREKAESCKSVGDKEGRMDAERSISKIMGGLSVQFEAYPDLKANQNAMQLQEEIVSTENKLAFAKQAYNDSIERYKAHKASFPANIFVSTWKGALDQTFLYWALDEAVAKEREDYTVKL